MTSAVTLAQSASAGYTPFFKNRVINGAMRIDQRNLGASTTPAVDGVFHIDRWQSYGTGAAPSKYSVQRNAGAVTPPPGFDHYLGLTSLSAYPSAAGDYLSQSQYIEGNNIVDFAWGTSSAKTVTLSFWVRSSLSGQFGGAIQNAARNRSYPYIYTITSPNTWEYKTITIPGCPDGTWLTDNSIGCQVIFNIGVGTVYGSGTPGAWANANWWGSTGDTKITAVNGATWYITGVQLEVGSAATSFDYRNYGTELALCQRYFYRMYGVSCTLGIINQASGSWTLTTMTHPTTMRTNPTFGHNLTDAKRVVASPTANQWAVYNQNVGWGSISFSPASTFEGIFNGGGTTARGHAGGYYTTFSAGATHIYLGSNLYMEWAAEL